jgi:hypothetical protein
MGAFKTDWALSGLVPWTARECACAAMVHLGGKLEEIALVGRFCFGAGSTPTSPSCFWHTTSIFEGSSGQAHALGLLSRSAWLRINMAERIEKQIKRFTPTIRDLIIHRSIMSRGA